MLTKEQEFDLAEHLIKYICCDDNLTVDDDDTGYYAYCGTMNYLIDFRSAYEGFIDDLIRSTKNNREYAEDIRHVSTRKDEISLMIEDTLIDIFLDDDFIRVVFN